jgi:ATP-dependent Clp protease adaptor protein ClpS
MSQKGPATRRFRDSPTRLLCYKEVMRKSIIVSNQDKDLDESLDTGVIDKAEIKEPSFYKVLLLNDDFTPMDFVTHVLQKFFNKGPEEAKKIMLDVHQAGKGVAGVFSFEVAETKVFLTNNLAKQNKYPLKCTMEKE